MYMYNRLFTIIVLIKFHYTKQIYVSVLVASDDTINIHIHSTRVSGTDQPCDIINSVYETTVLYCTK